MSESVSQNRKDVNSYVTEHEDVNKNVTEQKGRQQLCHSTAWTSTIMSQNCKDVNKDGHLFHWRRTCHLLAHHTISHERKGCDPRVLFIWTIHHSFFPPSLQNTLHSDLAGELSLWKGGGGSLALVGE
jgi:hypothetical protein